MEKYNCKNIVFSSSATVYKAKLNESLDENDICDPVNPYGNTKLTIEKILNDVYISQPSPSGELLLFDTSILLVPTNLLL